jgi:hypothetical protein
LRTAIIFFSMFLVSIVVVCWHEEKRITKSKAETVRDIFIDFYPKNI